MGSVRVRNLGIKRRNQHLDYPSVSGSLYSCPMGNRELLKALFEFVARRSSQELRLLENPAKTIYIDSNEVSEFFQWSEPFNTENFKGNLLDELRVIVS